MWGHHTAAEFERKDADAAIATMTDHRSMCRSVPAPPGENRSGSSIVKIFIPQIKILEFSGLADFDVRDDLGGFLSEEDRNKLIALAREGSVASRVTRRANALVLLDDGWSCQEVANTFLLNDDTIRGWFKLFEQRGIEGLTSFDVGGSASFLSAEQEDEFEGLCRRDAAALDAPGRRLYRTGIRPRLRKPFGLIALLHRLGLEYHKPDIIPRLLNEEKQQAFIESYDNLLNSLGDTQWCCSRTRRNRPMRRGLPAAGHQDKRSSRSNKRSGRERINIHGAIDLATGQTRMIEVVTVDAVSTIRLLQFYRGALSDVGAHPCLSRQRALSSRQAGAGMACATRVPD